MKNWKHKIALLGCMLLIIQNGLAKDPPANAVSPTQGQAQTMPDSEAKKKEYAAKLAADQKKEIEKAEAEKNAEAEKKTPEKKATCNWPCGEKQARTSLIVSIFFFIIMGLLVFKFFKHVSNKEHFQRLGFQSIKLIGFILMFPGICILALVGGPDILSGQTLAVLLGTIAGYILSKEDDPAKDSQQIQDFKKQIAEFEKLLKQTPPPPPEASKKIDK